MEAFVTGTTIKKLREEKRMTQGELAQMIGVSDKAVSKWETGRGLPDISLLEPLSRALGISVAELFAGQHVTNANRHSNIRKMKFYVCPVCGNVIYSVGEIFASCCGVRLPALEAEAEDEEHHIAVDKVEDEYYITLDHPMDKSHHISFMCYVTSDEIHFKAVSGTGCRSAIFFQRGMGTYIEKGIVLGEGVRGKERACVASLFSVLSYLFRGRHIAVVPRCVFRILWLPQGICIYRPCSGCNYLSIPVFRLSD